jgi:hypothetical protein
MNQVFAEKKKLTQAQAITIEKKLEDGANKSDVAKYLENFEVDTRVEKLLKLCGDE